MELAKKLKTLHNNSHRYKAATNWHTKKCKAKSPESAKAEGREEKTRQSYKVGGFCFCFRDSEWTI